MLLKIPLLHLYSGPLELFDSSSHYSDQLSVDSSWFHVRQPESALGHYFSICLSLLASCPGLPSGLCSCKPCTVSCMHNPEEQGASLLEGEPLASGRRDTVNKLFRLSPQRFCSESQSFRWQKRLPQEMKKHFLVFSFPEIVLPKKEITCSLCFKIGFQKNLG